MKKVISSILCIFFLYLYSSTVFASSFSVSARIRNQQTGETVTVPSSKSKSTEVQNPDGSFSNSSEIDFRLPHSSTAPLNSDSSSTETDVKATITITYDRSGDKIRVTKVSGSWVPSTSQIFLNNREVHYGDGVPFGGHSAHQYPTNNTFSYTTGWGWVDWYPASSDGFSGARAYSSAVVQASGMASHTIEAFVTATQ